MQVGCQGASWGGPLTMIPFLLRVKAKVALLSRNSPPAQFSTEKRQGCLPIRSARTGAGKSGAAMLLTPCFPVAVRSLRGGLFGEPRAIPTERGSGARDRNLE